MKRIKLITLLFVLSSISILTAAFAGETEKKTLVWAGIDFTYIQMIGPDFNDPQQIFPGYLNKWNELFVNERIKILSNHLKKDIISDIESVYNENKKASSKQIIRFPKNDENLSKSYITDELIEKQIKKYKFNTESGIALVYFADQFNKFEKKGAIYAVYFDISTRKIISSKRYIKKASGFGFRNYWFRVIKDVEPSMK